MEITNGFQNSPFSFSISGKPSSMISLAYLLMRKETGCLKVARTVVSLRDTQIDSRSQTMNTSKTSRSDSLKNWKEAADSVSNLVKILAWNPFFPPESRILRLVYYLNGIFWQSHDSTSHNVSGIHDSPTRILRLESDIKTRASHKIPITNMLIYSQGNQAADFR